MPGSRIQRELALLLTGKDVSASKALKNVDRQLTTLQKHAGRGMRNLGRNIEREMFVLGTAAVGAIGYSVKLAGDFEAQMNTINTIVRETPEGLKEIGDGIRELSRDTGIATGDLTAAYYDLVSAGIDAGQAQRVLNAATTLGVGGLASTAQTVDILTTALNSYGIAADQQGAKASQFADVFAKAIERGKLTAADIAGSFSTMGSLAATYGISIEEIGAAYAQMTAKGIPAGEAMTQMNSAVVALLKRSSDMEKLEKATGKSYLAIAGKKGLVVALQQLRDDAKKAGIPLMDLLGRKEALNFLLATTDQNLESYNANLAAMGDATGTAAEQMGERQKGLNYQMALLKANIDDAAITIGTELIPELAALAAEGTDWIRDHQPEIKQFAKDLANGLREAVKWARSLDWGRITAALQAGAGFGKTLIEAFVNAPPWVQEFLAGGFIANKMTDGVLGDIFSDLSKGLIRGVLGMNAGVVNLKAGVVNGGGMGGPAGGGGGGGSLVARGIGIAIAAAMALEIASLAKSGMFNDIFKNTPVGTGWTDPELTKQATGSQAAAERMVANGISSSTDLRHSLDATNDALRQLTQNDWLQPLADALYGSQIEATRETARTLFGELARRGEVTSEKNATSGAFGVGKGFTGTQAAQLQGIYERAIAAGKDPNAKNIVRTLEKNQARAAEAAQRERQATIDVRSAAIATAAAIRDKDLSVSVTTNLKNQVNVNARNVANAVVTTRLRSVGGNGVGGGVQ